MDKHPLTKKYFILKNKYEVFQTKEITLFAFYFLINIKTFDSLILLNLF
jgi:hypothetical protein